MWFITIFTECVSGTKAGDAEAHYCNEKRRKIKIYKNFIIIFLLINEQIFFEIRKIYSFMRRFTAFCGRLTVYRGEGIIYTERKKHTPNGINAPT